MKKSIPLPTMAFPLVTAGLMALAPAAKAEMAISPRTAMTKQVKSTAGSGAARFDWLARSNSGEAGETRRVVQRVTLGNGSWICSPAGFNRQSRCYRR